MYVFLLLRKLSVKKHGRTFIMIIWVQEVFAHKDVNLIVCEFTLILFFKEFLMLCVRHVVKKIVSVCNHLQELSHSSGLFQT